MSSQPTDMKKYKMMGKYPSLADQLEDVADSLLEAAYAVTAIAEQLREKPTKRGKDGGAFSKERQDGGRRASKARRIVAKF
jgi:hypothetical protein